MQTKFFNALQSIDVDDTRAEAVVESLESYSAMKMIEAVQPLINRIDSFEAVMLAKFEALSTVRLHEERARERRQQTVRWAVGTVVALVAAVLGALKVLGHL